MGFFTEEEKAFFNQLLLSYRKRLLTRYSDIIKEVDLLSLEREVPIEDDMVLLSKGIDLLLEAPENWGLLPERTANLLFMIMDEGISNEGIGNEVLEKLGYLSYTKNLAKNN
jgi:hypothetical protein